MIKNSYDVIVAGGGVMGCATATCLLKSNPRLNLAIVEMDATYARASTPLSDGNHRIQFNIKENIQISQYGLKVLETFAEDMAVDDDRPDVAFRRQGNLFLVDAEGREEAEQGLALQQSLGCRVEWVSPEAIKQLYPLYNLYGCVGGTFGQDDGTMSPHAVLMGYKNKAVSMGAQFIQARVAELLAKDNQIVGVGLDSGDKLTSAVVVNGAGAWAQELTQTVGVALPVEPVKRQVFIVETNARPEKILPAIFFPSGLYCIHEGEGHFMVGKSLPDDPVDATDFNWNRQRFEKYLWEELIDFLPDFDRLKLVRGWAGLYAENRFDGNAILGEWPTLNGLFLANGFSGHGFQQCHAVGRYLAELILKQPPALDLSIFAPDRILKNKPVFESQRKLI